MSEAGDGFEWTNTTLAQLGNLWAEGHSTAEIGRRIGISKNAVVGKAHRVGLPARPSPIRVANPLAPKRLPTRRPMPKLPEIMPTRSTALLVAGAAAAAVSPDVPAPPATKPVIVTREARPRATDGRTHPCCWPIGDPGTAAFGFCEAHAPLGKPYCTEHASVAYARIRRRSSEADPNRVDARAQLGRAPNQSPRGGRHGMAVP